jgi:hypothetical protein
VAQKIVSQKKIQDLAGSWRADYFDLNNQKKLLLPPSTPPPNQYKKNRTTQHKSVNFGCDIIVINLVIQVVAEIYIQVYTTLM